MEIRIFTQQKGKSFEDCIYDDDCLITTVQGRKAEELAEDFDLEDLGDYAEADISDAYVLEDFGVDITLLEDDVVYLYLD